MVEASLKNDVEAFQAKLHGSESGLEIAIKACDPTKFIENTLACTLIQIKSIRCSFCFGKGHDVRQCGTKKNIDRSVANVPGTRKVWGTLKSRYKVTGKMIGAKRAAKTSVENLEYAVG